MNSQTPPSRILFVCMGNICRSPTAEGVLERLIDERGLEALVEVDSAGTIAYHQGEEADPRMRQAAEERGYTLTSRARKVEPEDFDNFDLIVAMDRDNLEDLHELGIEGRAALRLLSDFLPAGSPKDVPDPYYGGAQGFEEVLDLIEQAGPALLDSVLSGAGHGAADRPAFPAAEST
ncbi:MAG: low molecular weight protein-tyrosine-phosphatase [Acidobacteriota bacterium]